MFSSPMSRSLSFSEPVPLDCEFHSFNCEFEFQLFLSFFSPPLGGAGWLKGAGIEYFPFPRLVRL